ncbi:FAD dependent oxidoreductase [Teladorsagia circumcincta]|uniref:FAD dependent oxidoreductase n=1 Tax=Teladorsagia circumcincta TaxID=45464 RepID=A0A2G9U2E0_TELCI|nr:FAD dependent oxidoreductase [Teladorsagia circumcincta]
MAVTFKVIDLNREDIAEEEARNGFEKWDNFTGTDAKVTFDWYAELCRQQPGTVTGVKLVSGHIQSDDKEALKAQERAYGDIVYNFRYLTDQERKSLFPNPSKHAIHFTSYAAEGNQYVPYLKEQLLNLGVLFVERVVKNIDEIEKITKIKIIQLAEEGYEVIVNSAGLNAGNLAGDDDGDLSLCEGYEECTAPKPVKKCSVPAAYRKFEIGMLRVKQMKRSDGEVTDEDRRDILERYEQLQPAMKGAKILSEWCGLRPARASIRVESQKKMSRTGKKYTLVHHYGHGGHGFTVGWGSARRAAALVDQAIRDRAKL